jgi:hypothetical protein
MSNSFADRVIDFNRHLYYSGELPSGFSVLNPYLDNPETIGAMEKFYYKFYNDNNPRKFILGINPSRHGAGITGVPFTDTKRLESICGITMNVAPSHEISSVFMYDLISQYGGAKEFYQKFYINSPFPLAIIRHAKGGKWLNANYYDDLKLYEAVKDFMIASLQQHVSLGLKTDEVFVLGIKNATFVNKLNEEAKLFGNLNVLEHPRFIQQYRSKDRQHYMDKYIMVLND